jgi:hypothetical protein
MKPVNAPKQIAQGEESAIPRVPRMLREVCHKIELLNSHCIDTRSLTPQMREACFESGLTVLSFLSAVVKFMRSDIIYSGSGEC